MPDPIGGKCFAAVLLTLALLAFPPSAGAQGTKITLSAENKTLKEVLAVIEQKSQYIFFYSDQSVNLSKRVSVSVAGADLQEVLDKILDPAETAYRIVDRQVILYKKGASPEGRVREVTPPEKPKIDVSGRVTNADGEPVAGAQVIEKGTANGVLTDAAGRYQIKVKSPISVLVFSYVGLQTTERQAGSGAAVNPVMAETVKAIEEVVVVGYGKQRKESVTGAISSITSKELVQSPQANVSNMLVGRLPGVIATQRSGAPGEDQSSLLIRGVGTFTDNTAPLVMVDGVERTNFNGMDPNEIESLNILKDASATAIYGVRGANGVVLITTRKGKVGAPLFSYSGNVALQQATALPDYLNSPDYATLYNEAQRNDARVSGQTYTPRFSDKDIELYRNGFDPILHPDMDWINDFLRDYSWRTQHNFNISGGTERVKYFVSAGYFNQEGIYKNTKVDRDHDVNSRNQRYNFRSNLDFQVTRDFSASVQLSAQIEQVNQPHANSSNGNSEMWQAISYANPLNSPGMVDDKIIRILNGLGSVNPYLELLSNGYRRDNRNTVTTTMRLDYDLSEPVTKGLAVHASISYDSYSLSRKKYTKTYPYYLAQRDADDPNNILLTPKNEETPWSFGTEWGKNRKTYFEAGVNYDRTFGRHAVTGLVLYNQSKYFSPTLTYLVPNAYQGLVGRVTYNFARRYMAEFNMGYNGTENFAEGKRFGFFPAFSAGWVITEEPFFPKNKWVNFLKVRGSYGEVGNDKIGGDRFLYLPSSYGDAADNALNDYYFGLASEAVKSVPVIENKIGNPDLTWEKARKMNLGFEGTFFNQMLSLSFDVFKERRNNILANRSTEPMIIGATLPAYNFGEMENRGWEVDVNFRQTVRKFTYWARLNYSFARNEVIYKDEIPKKYAYQMETGRSKDQFFGLIFDGYYNSWAEVNALDRPVSSWSSNRLQPGDVRYVDVNGDGVIDDYDRVPVGYTPIPEIIYGISCGASWKGFDFSVLFQGADNVSIKYFGRSMWPFSKSEESAKSLIWGRWTEERYLAGEEISFPRLSLAPNRDTDHNYRESSLWIRDASYLRLKNAEIGYTFQGRLTRKLGLGSLRVYMNGSNLFTWTDVIDLDPEAPSRSGNAEINTYPLQKVYNLGINITF